MTDEGATTKAAKRAALLASKAERARVAAAKQEDHELLCLELEERYCTELGVRGEAWELVNEVNSCGEGPIVIKLGDPLKDKIWKSKPGAAPEDVQAYTVDAVVYPERRQYLDIVDRRPNIGIAVAEALSALFGFKEGLLKGKS